MKHILRSMGFGLLIACTSRHELKISVNQQKFSVFIKKYQDSILVAADSVSKDKIFMNMWLNRVKYIQDPFKFPTIATDTFIFEKSIVTDFINPKDDKEYLEIALDNGNYATEIIYTGEKNGYLQESAMYRMAKNLKENIPVKVIGNLMKIQLSFPSVERGMKKIMLDFRVDSVVNVY